MDTGQTRIGQLITGAGGVMLIISLFLPWVDIEGLSRSGWELWTMADVLFLIAGLFAIGTAITGGRFGLFRPDLSLSAATDLLGVVSTLLIGWLIVFDFPVGAGREIGVYLGLIAAMAVAGGAGDYRVLSGASLFPTTTENGRSTSQVEVVSAGATHE